MLSKVRSKVRIRVWHRFGHLRRPVTARLIVTTKTPSAWSLSLLQGWAAVVAIISPSPKFSFATVVPCLFHRQTTSQIWIRQSNVPASILLVETDAFPKVFCFAEASMQGCTILDCICQYQCLINPVLKKASRCLRTHSKDHRPHYGRRSLEPAFAAFFGVSCLSLKFGTRPITVPESLGLRMDP